MKHFSILLLKMYFVVFTNSDKLKNLYERSEASNKALLAETEEQQERHSQLLAQFEQLQNFFEQQQVLSIFCILIL